MDSPVILNKTAKIQLAYARFGVTPIYGELGRCKPGSAKQHLPILFKRGKGVGATKIVPRDIVKTDATKTHARFEGMRPHRPHRVVLKFPPVFSVKRLTNLGAT